MADRTGKTNGPNVSFAYSDTHFMAQGICSKRPEIDFFAQGNAGIARAEAACVGCPVLEACRDFAIATNIEFGVWGGMSRNKRKVFHRATRALEVGVAA